MPGFGQLREVFELWAELPGVRFVDGKCAALTFDDGPDPAGTPAVLDALDREHIKATFFLVGEQVEAHPALAAEVVARGHAIGVHCFEHVDQRTLKDPGLDLERGLEAIEAATGHRPRLHRPPYGRISRRSWEACGELGLEPVYWSAWGMDWEAIPAERIAELVLRDLEPGAIVLLHDSPRYGHRADAAPTAEALAAIAAAGVPLGPISAASS